MSTTPKLTKTDKDFIKLIQDKKMIHTDDSKRLIQIYNTTFNAKTECYTCASVLQACLEKLKPLLIQPTLKNGK